MFGVTTSDDYRPVTWMGRFPVDVTTILVAVHVVVAILTCLESWLLAAVPCSTSCFSIAHASWGPVRFGASPPTRSCIPPACCSGSRSKCTCSFVFGREVERFIGQRAYIALHALLAFGPFACPHRLGLGTTDRTGRLTCVAFRNFRSIRGDLPGGRAAAAYHRKMDRSYSGRDLRPAIAGLQCLDRSSGPLNKHRGWLCFVRYRGVGPELVWWENLEARLQPKPKFKVVPKPTPARRDDDDISESVDPILDKIARSGIVAVLLPMSGESSIVRAIVC